MSSDALVLFGATGDLAHRKIFPALAAMAARRHLKVPVIAIARAGWSLDRLRARVRDSLKQHGPDNRAHRAAAAKLCGLLRYVDGDYREPATFDRICEALGPARRPLYYLAIPPDMFPVVVQGLGKVGCAEGRVVVEKPFGRDLASARALNRVLLEVFDESAIFRIDHYLGKEAVQNLLYFRFANSFLEPIWNRNYIKSVQITMAERIGVEGRGAFYEEVGAIRDVVQNHMLQTVANLAMEPPVGESSAALRDERAKVLSAIRPLTRARLVRGQYTGYRDEPGVAARSTVETFAAMRLYLDSWRWEGVPFFIRAGKRLAVTAAEALVVLRRPPQKVFDEVLPARPDDSNYYRFRLGPDRVAIGIGARTKKIGTDMSGEDTELYVCNAKPGEMDAYERLIGDAMRGDAALFARQDGVEAAWRVVDPILRAPAPLYSYRSGSWGPAEANALTASVGGWHSPKAAANV